MKIEKLIEQLGQELYCCGVNETTKTKEKVRDAQATLHKIKQELNIKDKYIDLVSTNSSDVTIAITMNQIINKLNNL